MRKKDGPGKRRANLENDTERRETREADCEDSFSGQEREAERGKSEIMS